MQPRMMLSEQAPALHADLSQVPDDGHLRLANLLNDFEELALLLRSELERSRWLDAFLLAAGMNQILEDYLHRDPFALSKVAEHVAHLRQPLGGMAVRTAEFAGRAAWGIRNWGPQTARLMRWQVELAAFVSELAAVVVSPGSDTAVLAQELSRQGGSLLAAVRGFPRGLRRSVVRLPSCFRSFDQQPADLARIVQSFTRRWPDRNKPLVVVGARTSGSYLAPLIAALLAQNGYHGVHMLTFRNGQQLLRYERTVLQTVACSGGLILLTDDPPSSGSTLARVAAELERYGCQRRSIVLLLQLFGAPDALPAALQNYESVILPWSEWSIHQQLAPDAVRSTLAALLGPEQTVTAMQALPLPPALAARGHVRARYQVRMDDECGRSSDRQVYVRGVGLGYFGAHAVAVDRALRGFLPEVYGVRDGLLYRAWLPSCPDACETQPNNEMSLAQGIADYTLARSRALAVKEDMSFRLLNRRAVWQLSSDLLGYPFGRSAPFMRPLLHRAAKRLVQVELPAVIDGGMAVTRWFADEAQEGHVRKVSFDDGAFSNLDMACYDPAFDVAGAAISAGRPALARYVREAYERMTDKRIGEERWLLYQVLHLQAMQWSHEGEVPGAQRALARVQQRYYAATFFRDIAPSSAGPICAIDIDGVLETGWLGFCSTTPAGCLALRALARHGYQVVLATGRSLDEVRERCESYALVGGIAEYGAVAYDHRTGTVHHLLSEADRADLDHLRAVLRGFDGVHLDPDYRCAVRAYHLEHENRRRGLRPEEISTALAESGMTDRIQPILGVAQTDFMVTGIDKGVGLRVLATQLGTDGGLATEKPLALAVGDTVSDLPMFALAAFPFAPANADAVVRSAKITIMKRPYQAGLAAAVASLLGHAPGSCAECRPPSRSRDAALLLTALAAQGAGRRGKLRQALLLGMRVWTP